MKYDQSLSIHFYAVWYPTAVNFNNRDSDSSFLHLSSELDNLLTKDTLGGQ